MLLDVFIHTLSVPKRCTRPFRAMKREGLLVAAAVLLVTALSETYAAPVGVACEDLTKVEACIECIGSKCLACHKDRGATWSSDGRVTEVGGRKVRMPQGRSRACELGHSRRAPPCTGTSRLKARDQVVAAGPASPACSCNRKAAMQIRGALDSSRSAAWLPLRRRTTPGMLCARSMWRTQGPSGRLPTRGCCAPGAGLVAARCLCSVSVSHDRPAAMLPRSAAPPWLEMMQSTPAATRAVPAPTAPGAWSAAGASSSTRTSRCGAACATCVCCLLRSTPPGSCPLGGDSCPGPR